MKPQPMSAETVAEIWVENGSDAEDAEGFARAIIAARDAQWAAMIGEPVAWAAPDGSLFWSFALAQQQACNLGDKDASPLYAIKEQSE